MFDSQKSEGAGPQVDPVPARSTSLMEVSFVTATELRLITTLASDQLFRREFIDPRMPGNKTDPAEVIRGKKLVERLRSATGAYRKSLPRRNGGTT